MKTVELFELSSISGAYSFGFELSNMIAYHGGILFEGNDAVGEPALWFSKGTAKSTVELFELRSIKGAYSSGFELSNIIAYHGGILFEGNDMVGEPALWFSHDQMNPPQPSGGPHHFADIALLGNFMASTFPNSGILGGGTFRLEGLEPISHASSLFPPRSNQL